MKDKKHWSDGLKNWQQEQSKAYKTYIKTSAVGLEFALSIALAALVGYYLDRRFGWSPYALIIGVIIGSIAGIKRLWSFSKSYLEKEESIDDDNTKQ